MDKYITGALIKKLREEKKMTQAQLALMLNVSDKAVSKWETAKGYPDITLIEPLANILGVSVNELISGEPVCNKNPGANMLRSKFYVCPVCGNIIHAMGNANIACHGLPLIPCAAEAPDGEHKITVERIDGEYYVKVNHEMSKAHYISFIAAMSYNGLQTVKLYPEGDAEAHFSIRGVERIYFYCNRDGLFSVRAAEFNKT